MVKVTISRNRKGECIAFRCMGHAGYGDSGEDIVCAAVSALVINTVNSIGQLVGDGFEVEAGQEGGRIDFSLKEGYSKGSLLLLDSLVLGLQGIQKSYGKEYVSVKFKEV